MNVFSSRTGRVIDWAFKVDGKEVEVKMKGTVSVNDAGSAYVTYCGLEGFGLIQPALSWVLPHLQSGQLVEVLPAIASRRCLCRFRRSIRTVGIPSPKVRVFVDWPEYLDRCPLLSGRGSLDTPCSKRTIEERESAPTLDTPVITEVA